MRSHRASLPGSARFSCMLLLFFSHHGPGPPRPLRCPDRKDFHRNRARGAKTSGSSGSGAQPAAQPSPQPACSAGAGRRRAPDFKTGQPPEKTPAIVSTPPAKPHPAKIIVPDALHPTRAALAKGAVQAQPDELHNPPPVYPEESRAAREQGTVMLRVDVSGMGHAGRVLILKSSGYFRLDQSARKAVLAWRFQPASIGGASIDSEIDVPIQFRLE